MPQPKGLTDSFFDLVASVLREHGFPRYITPALRALSCVVFSKHNPRAITALMVFLDRWEQLINKQPKGITRDAHHQMIRVCRGVPKVWRLWKARKWSEEHLPSSDVKESSSTVINPPRTDADIVYAEEA